MAPISLPSVYISSYFSTDGTSFFFFFFPFFFLFDLDVQHHEHRIVRLKRPPPATLTIVGRFTSANARWSSEESRLSGKLESWLLLRIGAPCLVLLLQHTSVLSL